MTFAMRGIIGVGLAAILVLFQPAARAEAQESTDEIPASLAFADLVDLSDSSQIVLRAQIRTMARVEDERAPGLRAGQGRFYVRAKTLALLLGRHAIGDSLTYLVDLPLDQRGRPPKIKKQEVLLFARPVKGRPGELQLVARDGQLLWSEQREAIVRSILTDLVSPDAPPVITGVREIIHVPGTLAGSGETQVFLATQDKSAASITIRRRQGRSPAWGISYSELVADVTRPPRPGTLEWYRLACSLPNKVSPLANLSETPSARRQALSDYRMVLGELGICRRKRG